MSTTASTVPTWVKDVGTWSGYVGGLLTAGAKIPGLSSTTAAVATTAVPTIGIETDIGAIATAAGSLATLLADAVQLAELITGAKNTPAYLAAVAAQNNQDQIDEINKAVSTGDLDALRRLSSL